MYVIQCDKCGKRTAPAITTGCEWPWRKIVFGQGYPHKQVTYHICPECAVALKLPEEQNANMADQLLDILSEIAQEAVDNR